MHTASAWESEMCDFCLSTWTFYRSTLLPLTHAAYPLELTTTVNVSLLLFWTLPPSSWVSDPEWIFHLLSFLLACSYTKALFLACMQWSQRSHLVWHLPFPPIIGVHCISVYTTWQPSLFDPLTCSRQAYPQALVEPWTGLGLEQTTYCATAQHRRHMFLRFITFVYLKVDLNFLRSWCSNILFRQTTYLTMLRLSLGQ